MRTPEFPPATEHDDWLEYQTIAFEDYLCTQCRAAVPPRLHSLEHIRFENRMEAHTNTGGPFDVTTNEDLPQHPAGEIVLVGREGCQRTEGEALGGAGGKYM